jgi:ATP-dependent protease HslVU (ClpYQ) peptidase subunit
MKELTKKDERLAKKCLKHLEDWTKEQLLEDMEQLLLALAEQGKDLTSLEFYYSNHKQSN